MRINPAITQYSVKHRNWDIFCKVVDNYGDIGVCWRLASQLQAEFGIHARLFVDDLIAAAQLIPALNPSQAHQQCNQIEVIHWHDGTIFDTGAHVVIEAFACGLPPSYWRTLQASTYWINLEYLSAEPWVATFHARHSLLAEAPCPRHFFFPGFSTKTGGLLREKNLLPRRDAFLKSNSARAAFLQKLSIKTDNRLLISLFFYANAPVSALLDALITGEQAVLVLAPYHAILQSCAHFFGVPLLQVGDQFKLGQLTLQVLPFLSQTDYDQLLWLCDLNFVRGEDSWLRALWAAKPFIWQPYFQTENTHLVKLKAFMNAFYVDAGDVNHIVSRFHLAWSSGEFSAPVWENYRADLPAIADATQRCTQLMAMQADLTHKLVTFCEN